jgi:hypothetical protein
LRTIGALRALDNVDGLFGDYFSGAFQAYFSKRTRFVAVDLAKADQLFAASRLPYAKVVQDAAVLGQLTRALRVESLVRTKVLKQGSRYRVVLEWLHSPRMDVLGSEEFWLAEPSGPGERLGVEWIGQSLWPALDRLFAQVPFLGSVNGRDGASVTVSVGDGSRVSPGDELRVATLEEVKRHPLLGKIVDWRFSSTGRLLVAQVEDGLAFCELIEEEPGRRISRGQKVVQRIPAPETPAAAGAVVGGRTGGGEAPWGVSADSEREGRGGPRLGWAAIGFDLGGMSRSYSQVTGGTGYSASGFLFGSRFDSQLWLDRKWFAEGSLGASTASMGLTDTLTGAPVVGTSVSSSLFSLKIAAGRTFLASGDFLGPRGWLKLGFQTLRFSQPIVSTRGVSPQSFSGAFVGLGADLPLRGGYGALLGIDLGLFNSTVEKGLALETPAGAHAVSFFLGGYARLSPRLKVRAGVDAVLTGVDYASNGGTTVSQKAISFSPSLVYFF